MLEKFCEPYLALFQVRFSTLPFDSESIERILTSLLETLQQTDSLLSSPTLTPTQHTLLLKTLLLLLQLYHDLNSQDLPEFFEDRLIQFMSLLLKYLDYTPSTTLVPVEENEDEEEEAGDLERVKAEICEIATLYSLRYLDAMGEGGFLQPFVERTWGLLTRLGSAVKYDIVRPFFLVLLVCSFVEG